MLVAGPAAQRPVPELYKFDTARFARFGLLKYFFWLEVHKAQPHSALTHNAFHMTLAAASAEIFLGVQRHDGMTRPPRYRRSADTAQSRYRFQETRAE